MNSDYVLNKRYTLHPIGRLRKLQMTPHPTPRRGFTHAEISYSYVWKNIYWNCNKVAVLIILISDYNFAHTFWLINKMFIAVYIIVFCIAMKVFGLIWPYLKRSVKWIIYLFSWRIHLHLKIIRKLSESIRREHWYSFLGHSKLSIFDLFSIFLCIHVLSYVLHHFSSPLSIFHPILSFFIQIQKNK